MEVLTRLAILLTVLAPLRAQPAFHIHMFHAQKLGRLDCNLCHVAVAKGSVELKRPGHEQCKLCHAPEFEKGPTSALCAECHASKHPSHASVLIDFSHARHMDPKARVDIHSGVRADCAFCHKVDPAAARAAIPSHTQCAACHAQAGIQPELSTFLRTSGCRGCHAPEQMESGPIARQPAIGFDQIRFSHASHRHTRQLARLDCTTCHYAIPRSTTLTGAPLPKMADCAGCHGAARAVPAVLHISNCKACHIQTEFNFNVRPASHTEVFRRNHAEASNAPDAKCFACHQNAMPGKDQCAECHMGMKPVSHTARWRDDVHGKYAALDRTSCATCHATDYCNRCHNELPSTHVPLPIFKNGGHANLAASNERACFTCHTFQNTCSTCHAQQLQHGGVIKR